MKGDGERLMSNGRYTWVAIDHDGHLIKGEQIGGGETRPPAHPREFHLLPVPEARARGLRPFSLFLTPNQRLIYRRRRHVDSVAGGAFVEDQESVIYIVGYEEDLDYAHFATYAMLLPDGRVEWSSNLNHITIHERNTDVDPPRFYER